MARGSGCEKAAAVARERREDKHRLSSRDTAKAEERGCAVRWKEVGAIQLPSSPPPPLSAWRAPCLLARVHTSTDTRPPPATLFVGRLVLSASPFSLVPIGQPLPKNPTGEEKKVNASATAPLCAPDSAGGVRLPPKLRRRPFVQRKRHFPSSVTVVLLLQDALWAISAHTRGTKRESRKFEKKKQTFRQRGCCMEPLHSGGHTCTYSHMHMGIQTPRGSDRDGERKKRSGAEMAHRFEKTASACISRTRAMCGVVW